MYCTVLTLANIEWLPWMTHKRLHDTVVHTAELPAGAHWPIGKLYKTAFQCSALCVLSLCWGHYL